ncbi:MAG: hypothetical protein AB8B65_06015 [Kordia sp.]|uniref:hypothetical protein n=1 Tax=Kordia sp. TaxID=1965332 RepID=UPI00385B2CDE
MALAPITNYDQIELDLAKKYAETWQETCDLKAFLFHRNDIECILSEKNAIAVRFYMGIKEEGDTKCPDMMVVGVYSNNEDIIITGPKSIGPNDEIRTGIYNFTMPCPRTCDFDSELYFETGPEIIGSQNCAPRDGNRTPSTDSYCNIEGFQIGLIDAVKSTTAWQTLFNLKSVLFKKEDLTEIFAQLEANDIRVYFGLDETGTERIILVGVDENGSDIFKEICEGENCDHEDCTGENCEVLIENLYINSSSLCTKESLTTCDESSELYHKV